MKRFAGEAKNIETSIVALVTHNPLSLSRCDSVLVTEKASLLSKGFAGLITKDSGKNKKFIPQTIVPDEAMNQLEDGDCVLIGKDGTITIVWEKKAPVNPLLLTEMCDCCCLMCPQPPKHTIEL